MITLGGVAVSDNMYLSGLENAKLAAITEYRTIGGEIVFSVQPQVGGRKLTLGSQSSGSVQGIWCMHTIESLKLLEAQVEAVELNYQGAIYNVLIESMDFTPFVQNEVEGPNKGFTGTINLIEV